MVLQHDVKSQTATGQHTGWLPIRFVQPSPKPLQEFLFNTLPQRRLHPLLEYRLLLSLIDALQFLEQLDRRQGFVKRLQMKPKPQERLCEGHSCSFSETNRTSLSFETTLDAMLIVRNEHSPY